MNLESPLREAAKVRDWAGEEAADEVSSAHGTGARWYLSVLLILIAWCTYLHVPLVSGGRLLVPSFPTIVLSPFLFLLLRRDLTESDAMFLLKVGFVLLLSMALSPGYAYLEQKFLSMAQFLVALGIAVLIVRLMQRLGSVSLERALLALWVLIVVGSVLEMLGVLKAASDAFRTWAYTDLQGIYQSDARDLNMVGWPRPKLFSEEPSHVTKFFVVAINAWLLTRVSFAKAAIAAGATSVMLVIMGSPMLLVCGFMILAILIWNQQIPLFARIATVTGIVLVGTLGGAYFAADSFVNVVSRVSQIDQSAVAVLEQSPGIAEDALGGDEKRVVLPWATLADVWRRWPIFGVGVGGKEVIAEYRNLSSANTTLLVGNNAFASIGIFLGVLGGSAFIALVIGHARKTGVRRLGLLVVLVFLFSALIGGIDSIRYWGFVALLWGALAVADSSLNKHQEM